MLTQEAVYDTLLRPRRGAHHERAGQAIEALYPERLDELSERFAYHYSRSPNSTKALEYLHAANRKATTGHAMVEARTHFEQAMRILDAAPDTLANRHRRIALVAEQARKHQARAQEIFERLGTRPAATGRP